LEGEILHVSEYILTLIRSGTLKLKATQTKVTLADSEFLGRYNGLYEAPRDVIRTSAGDRFIEMQWNHEYLQSAGEAVFTFGGILFDRGKELGRKISQKAEDIEAEIIVTLSATAKSNISATTNLKVMDIAEFVKEHLKY
jgi:Fe-S oxidoreductase